MGCAACQHVARCNHLTLPTAIQRPAGSATGPSLLTSRRMAPGCVLPATCGLAGLCCTRAAIHRTPATPLAVPSPPLQVPSRTNFTSLATPTQVGSGRTALVTLLHEGALRAWKGDMLRGAALTGVRSGALQHPPPTAVLQAATRLTLPMSCSAAPSSGGGWRLVHARPHVCQRPSSLPALKII